MTSRFLRQCCAVILLASPGTGVLAQSNEQTSKPGAGNIELLHAQVRVVDSKGKPIAGVKVVPWALRSSLGHGMWRKGGLGNSEPVAVTTNRDGIAQFAYPKYALRAEEVLTTNVSCRFEHSDYADTAYNNVPVPEASDRPSDFTLQRGAGVVFTPLDENLEPISKDIYPLWSGDSFWSSLNRQTVGADGKLRLPRLSAGEEVVRLVRIVDETPTHFSAPLPLTLTDGEDMELMESLIPAVKIEGRLSDNVPRPVVNGRVVASVINRVDGDGYETIFWQTWAPVAADGTFVIQGLPAEDAVQLIAICDNYLAKSGETPDFALERERKRTKLRRAQVFRMPEAGTARITLPMEASGACEFVVLSPSGEPLAGMEVDAWPNIFWWNGGSQLYGTPLGRTSKQLLRNNDSLDRIDEGKGKYPPPYRVTTDKRGRAVLKNLPSSRVSYRVSEPMGKEWQYQSWGSKVEVPPGGTHRRTVTLKAKKKAG